jgi:DnaA-homolog protein
VTRQLALPIISPPTPTLDNFVVGSNTELLAQLRGLAAGRCAEAVLYLWGAPGSGRSHLLEASAAAASAVADDVEALDGPGQIGLFNAINRARESGGTVLAAGAAPPARLALREDLRSRLGWGLVYEVKPLSDADKAHFLQAEAARRGLRLGDDAIGYLLTHARRDMPALHTILEHLDRASLEQRRPLTLPLVREALRTLES